MTRFKIGNPSWRALVVWWSALGVALIATLVLLWSIRPASDSTPTPDQVVTGMPETGSASPEPAAGQLDLPPVPVDPVDPAPGGSGPTPAPDLDPADLSASLTDGVDQPDDFDLPEDWDRLAPDSKIFLNPRGCNSETEKIDLVDGRCRPLSSLTKPAPWNPIAIGRVSITELDRSGDLLVCSDSDPAGPGSRPPESPPGAGTNLTCALRLTLEMTVDGFYFNDGCRAFRRGFVRLELSPAASLPAGYDSLNTAGPNAICPKVVIPVAKGQQLEQVFQFNLKAADLGRRLERVGFNQLNPTVQIEGRFGLVLGRPPVAPDPLNGIVRPNPWADLPRSHGQ